MVAFRLDLQFEKTSMTSNNDFLPANSPLSFTCVVEFKAIRSFPFHDKLLKRLTSFQESKITVMKSEPMARNQRPYIVDFRANFSGDDRRFEFFLVSVQ